MNGPHAEPPIGAVLWTTVTAIGRAFDDALGTAGGSRPIWSILLALKSSPTKNQRELAAEVGIRGATLTHHLTIMEERGLVTRRRDPANRRVHIVELTETGETAFERLKDVAVAFDAKLRTDVPLDEIQQLRHTLDKLRSNVVPPA
jgi:MarR family transcriptional regulator, transcriptional regulator for hemolysin